jgi:hypothetical protein
MALAIFELNFFTTRVTDEETWDQFLNADTKEQLKQCTHIHQTSRECLNTRCVPARKLLVTFFWDRKGVLMVEVMQQGIAIMSCTANKIWARQNQNGRMLTS